MAKYKVREIADKIGVKAPNLYTQCNRGKLVIDQIEENGKIKKYIDDQNPINVIFLSNYNYYGNSIPQNQNTQQEQTKNIPEEIKETIEAPVTKKQITSSIIKKQATPTRQKQTVQSSKSNPVNESLYQIKQQIEVAKLEKLEEEKKLLEIKRKKQEGKVLPTDIVKQSYNITMSHLVTLFYNMLENQSNLLMQIHNIPAEDVAKAKARIRDEMNKEVEEAREASKKEILSIVREYSEEL